ncbi:unnamed protein product, partial [Urochloa humidicola]
RRRQAWRRCGGGGEVPAPAPASLPCCPAVRVALGKVAPAPAQAPAASPATGSPRSRRPRRAGPGRAGGRFTRRRQLLDLLLPLSLFLVKIGAQTRGTRSHATSGRSDAGVVDPALGRLQAVSQYILAHDDGGTSCRRGLHATGGATGVQHCLHVPLPPLDLGA